jgi:hypothetical protein
MVERPAGLSTVSLRCLPAERIAGGATLLRTVLSVWNLVDFSQWMKPVAVD